MGAEALQAGPGGKTDSVELAGALKGNLRYPGAGAVAVVAQREAFGRNQEVDFAAAVRGGGHAGIKADGTHFGDDAAVADFARQEVAEGEELGNETGAGTLHDGFRGVVLHDAALSENSERVGKAEGFFLIVGNDNGGHVPYAAKRPASPA